MKPVRTFDQERIHLNIARLKKSGVMYEIVVDPDKAVLFKEGSNIELEEVLMAEKIFFDAKKGEKASEERLNEVFGTSDSLTIAKMILSDGEIQLTSEHRAKVREEKRKQIITLISKNACDPKTKLPHPAKRIENALDEAKVHIDEFKKPEEQVQEIIKSLRPILPISVEFRTVEIDIPADNAAKLYGTIQRFGTVKQEQWLADGSWKGSVEVPAGMITELFEKLNNATHGGVETDIIN